MRDDPSFKTMFLETFAILFLCPWGLTFSWWGCYGLCLWHKPTELAHSFYSVLVTVSVFMALSTVFHSINYPDNSLLSYSVLVSALLVLSTVHLFMKVSVSPDIILCGWLGLKHKLINSYFHVNQTLPKHHPTLFNTFNAWQPNSQLWHNQHASNLLVDDVSLER